jgi:hypothetical protein
MHLVSTPDPNPGCAPLREVAASVKGSPIESTVLEVCVQPTLAQVGMLAPALLAAPCRTTVVKRFLSTRVE